MPSAQYLTIPEQRGPCTLPRLEIFNRMKTSSMSTTPKARTIFAIKKFKQPCCTLKTKKHTPRAPHNNGCGRQMTSQHRARLHLNPPRIGLFGPSAQFLGQGLCHQHKNVVPPAQKPCAQLLAQWHRHRTRLIHIYNLSNLKF